jgi:Asp-tRNA(Asn)/Glu-tRNA(Gln) amidotransferase C subunit
MDKESVRVKAKQIMDDFIDALEGIEELKEDVKVVDVDKLRKPSDVCTENLERNVILKNAPKSDGLHIIAEKKGW